MFRVNATEFRDKMHINPIQVLPADGTFNTVVNAGDFAMADTMNDAFQNVFQALLDDDRSESEDLEKDYPEEVLDTSQVATTDENEPNVQYEAAAKTEIDVQAAIPTRPNDLVDDAPVTQTAKIQMDQSIVARSEISEQQYVPINASGLRASDHQRPSMSKTVERGLNAMSELARYHDSQGQPEQRKMVQPTNTAEAEDIANGTTDERDKMAVSVNPVAENPADDPVHIRSSPTDNSFIKSTWVDRPGGPSSHDSTPLTDRMFGLDSRKAENRLSVPKTMATDPLIPHVEKAIGNALNLSHPESSDAAVSVRSDHSPVGTAFDPIPEKPLHGIPNPLPSGAGLSIETLPPDQQLTKISAESDLSINRVDPAVFSPTAQSIEGAHLRADVHRFPTAQVVQILAKQPDKPLEIALNPEELGRVRMSLSTTENAVTMVITTERPETLDLMRRHIGQLAQDMQALGYETVDFDFRHGQSGNQDTQDEGQAKLSAPDPDGDDVAATRLPETLSASAGLDLRL